MPPEGRGVSGGLSLRIQRKRPNLSVGLSGSVFGSAFGSIFRNVCGSVFGSAFGSAIGSKPEIGPRDSQAFHYWGFHAPSTYLPNSWPLSNKARSTH